MKTMVETLKIDQFTIPYSILGQGPPVLCSELPLNTFAFFTPLQEKLAEKYQVILLDLRPVVGSSDKKPPADDLLDLLSQISLRFMDALGIHEFTLMGSFMYGAVSMNTARIAPERVSNLILLSPLGLLRFPVAWMVRAITVFYRLPGIPTLMRFAPFRFLVEWTDSRLLGPRRMYQIFYEPEKIPLRLEDLYEHYKRPRNLTAGPALMWAIRKLRYEKLIPKLPEVRCPTLIIHGAEDKWIPRTYAAELQTRLPNARLLEIPRTRHAPEIENVDLTCTEILLFLNEQSSSMTSGHQAGN